MIGTKNTTAQELSTSKYLCFNEEMTYAINAKDQFIYPVSFDSIDDIQLFGTEISIYGVEYSINQIHQISFESRIFKSVLEKVHDIIHYSHNVSIYLNNKHTPFALRIAIGDEVFLVEML